MSIITDQLPGEVQPATSPPETETSLTTGQAAALLQVVPQTIARWASEGRLPHTRTLGGSKGRGHRRFRKADVRTLLAVVSDSAPGGRP